MKIYIFLHYIGLYLLLDISKNESTLWEFEQQNLSANKCTIVSNGTHIFETRTGLENINLMMK